MAPAVVDGLELIQVCEQDPDAALIFQEPLEGGPGVALVADAVVEPRQPIVDGEALQHGVELAQQAFLPDVLEGDLHEVEEALVQVGLGCLADVAEGQVSDGIAVVVQRVEHQEAFPLQYLLRQQFPARKAREVRPGPGRRLPAGPQHHVLPIAAGVVPLLLFEAVVVPVVDAQPDPFAAEDLPVRVHRVHQLRQAARRQHLLRHSLLPVVEALQEARLVEVAIPDGAGHRLVRAAAGL